MRMALQDSRSRFLDSMRHRSRARCPILQPFQAPTEQLALATSPASCRLLLSFRIRAASLSRCQLLHRTEIRAAAFQSIIAVYFEPASRGVVWLGESLKNCLMSFGWLCRRVITRLM